MQFFQRQHSTTGNDEITNKLPEHKNELIEHHRLSLKARWNGCKAGVPDETRKEIDDLFHKERKWTSTAEDWYALNYAEQCVGACLTATQVSAEYQSLIRIAFIRKWRLKHRPVADSLQEAGDRLFTFTRLPPSQWRSVRTISADYNDMIYAATCEEIETRRKAARRPHPARPAAAGILHRRWRMHPSGCRRRRAGA